MRRAHGLSLLELTAVVAILGIIALVMVPNYSASDLGRLDLAAHQVAEALRFARSQAMYSGRLHGVLIDSDDSVGGAADVAVFLPDAAASPFGLGTLARDPSSRQPYDQSLGGSPVGRGVRFATGARPFQFAGIAQAHNYVFFDAQGAPVWLQDGVLSRLTSGAVVLAHGRHRMTVSVAPVSGLVTVQ